MNTLFTQPFPEFETVTALSGSCGSIPPDCDSSGAAIGRQVNYQITRNEDDGTFNFVNLFTMPSEIYIGSGSIQV